MITSLYISSSCIEAVCGTKGKVSIKAWAKEPLSGMSVINGVIINEQEVLEAIVNLKSKMNLRKVSLVVDSSTIMAKQMSVPQLGGKKLKQFIETEFAAGAEHREDLMYDYMMLNPKNKNGGADVLAAAVERSFIEGYISLLNGLSIKIDSIDLASASVIRFVRSAQYFREKTCIMAVLDGNSINAFLFVNGKYRFFNRSRLFEERGTMESCEELAQIMSSLIQFNSYEKTGYKITGAYIGGIEEKEMKIVKQEEFSLFGEELPLKLSADGVENLFSPEEKMPTEKKESSALLLDELSDRIGVEVHLIPECQEVSINGTNNATDFKVSDYIYTVGNLIGR